MPDSKSSSKARFISLAGLSWIVVGAIGTVMLHFLLGSPLDDAALDERGRRVAAHPVRYELGTSSQMGAVQRYRVDLQFTDESGRELHTTLETDHQDQFEAAKAGTPIEIEYDPEDPSRARWAGGPKNPLGYLIYVIGGGVMLAGAVLAGFGFIARSRRA